jgi:hypothetical protein
MAITSDRDYIRICKRKIERALALENSNTPLKKRNFDYLSRVIEQKSGITISVSTLKRLWKDDFSQLPQPATLNALVAVLDYKDWQEFKQANAIKQPHNFKKIILILSGILIIILITMVLLPFSKPERIQELSVPKVNGPVQFSTKKTITSGLPNTVIFNYDVSNVQADSFFFQQSWNNNQRIKIDPNGKAISTIYYESGYQRAYLLANDSFIAMKPVHILSDDWEPHIYYSEKDLIPIDFSQEEFLKNGKLHVDKSLLEKQHVDLSRYFFTRIVNSRKFNISSDNFSLLSRIKLDSLQYSECPWINLIVVTEKHIFSVALQNKGCEHYAYYKLGEVERNGSSNDLSALGCNVYQWQEIGIYVHNKNATISINGKNCFNEIYKEDFGDIVSLIYIFERTGSIDFVELSDGNGNIAYEDTFE